MTDAISAAESTLDHFKFWKVEPFKAPGTVYLKGQFDKEEWEADLVSIEYLANPTEKRADGKITKIRNPELHYAAYAIDVNDPQPSRTVVAKNQLQDPTPWDLSDPKFLLTPAAKQMDGKLGDVPQGDHFVCYPAASRKLPKAVYLTDQFDRMMGPDRQEQIGELETVWFCVPVQKRVGDQTYPILNPRTHLAVYRFRGEPYDVQPYVRDQFGEKSKRLQVIGSELLGVPSLKNWLS